MIRIKKLAQHAKVPAYAHQDDAGMDLYASETKVLAPGERALIKTDIAMAIPKGYVGLIWDKSGIATKHGLKTMAGVIDSGYRGEVKILVKNLGKESFTVEQGNKIAQMLIQPVEQRPIEEVESLDETSRADGGFGSTGLK